MMNKKIIRIIAFVICIIAIFLVRVYKLDSYAYNQIGFFGDKYGISVSDILNSAIGAFFGMITSLMLEKLLESNSKKKSIDNIISELESIRDGLKKNIVDYLPEEIISAINDTIGGKEKKQFNEKIKIQFNDNTIKELDIKIKDLAYVIYVPIWETVLQTGYILEFKDKKYFEELILLYTKINRLKIIIDEYHNNREVDVSDIKMIVVACVELNTMFTNKEYYISKWFG